MCTNGTRAWHELIFGRERGFVPGGKKGLFWKISKVQGREEYRDLE